MFKLIGERKRKLMNKGEREKKRAGFRNNRRTSPYCHSLITALSGCQRSRLSAVAASVLSSTHSVLAIT